MQRQELQLASEVNRALAAGYARYLEEAEASRYDSRGVRMYSVSHCEHGSSRWTDYDNICGPCEDGLTMSDPLQRMQTAIGMVDSDPERAALWLEYGVPTVAEYAATLNLRSSRY